MALFNFFSSNTRIHVTRLAPGTDLKKALRGLAVRNKWSAAVMVTCVGSLVEYNLRFANQEEGTRKKGHFEIVSLTGTLSASAAHLHLAAFDENGVIIGGHLIDGNIVFTTAEVAIAELSELAFERQFDPASGYQELHIVGRLSRILSSLKDHVGGLLPSQRIHRVHHRGLYGFEANSQHGDEEDSCGLIRDIRTLGCLRAAGFSGLTLFVLMIKFRKNIKYNICNISSYFSKTCQYPAIVGYLRLETYGLRA